MKYFVIILNVFFTTLLLYAQQSYPTASTEQTLTPVNDNSILGFRISFYEQHIYYSQDAIYIRATIFNQGHQSIRIRIAENKIFNINFTVSNLENIEQPIATPFLQAKTTQKPILYRETLLLPGEEFSFIERLDQYVVLNDGMFIIQATFYPQLTGKNTVIYSNPLTLRIHTSNMTKYENDLIIKQQIEENLQKQILHPEEVILYVLNARVNNQKERFFLYFDLAHLYKSDPIREIQFTRLSEEEQFNALEDFKEKIWNGEMENIFRIPTNWEILHTEYSNNTGTVTVLQEYQLPQYTEKKQFIYKLLRQRNIWYITNYVVNNVNTEN